jgi:hypothetical protein
VNNTYGVSRTKEAMPRWITDPSSGAHATNATARPTPTNVAPFVARAAASGMSSSRPDARSTEARFATTTWTTPSGTDTTITMARIAASAP